MCGPPNKNHSSLKVQHAGSMKLPTHYLITKISDLFLPDIIERVNGLTPALFENLKFSHIVRVLQFVCFRFHDLFHGGISADWFRLARQIVFTFANFPRPSTWKKYSPFSQFRSFSPWQIFPDPFLFRGMVILKFLQRRKRNVKIILHLFSVESYRRTWEGICPPSKSIKMEDFEILRYPLRNRQNHSWECFGFTNISRSLRSCALQSRS